MLHSILNIHETFVLLEVRLDILENHPKALEVTSPAAEARGAATATGRSDRRLLQRNGHCCVSSEVARQSNWKA
jgi:hypothetical protein